jgi:hypothetical protein
MCKNKGKFIFFEKLDCMYLAIYNFFIFNYYFNINIISICIKRNIPKDHTSTLLSYPFLKFVVHNSMNI